MYDWVVKTPYTFRIFEEGTGDPVFLYLFSADQIKTNVSVLSKIQFFALYSIASCDFYLCSLVSVTRLSYV